ncbi:hypothetical protein [Nitrococcus mobilis]|uniref:hypothetical protein n=1 Tax=Nitrococcus mobilis TaxID=35797 RepID=UPI0002DB0F73|nr:hypothetical protein [Nitrococcus mobilis]
MKAVKAMADLEPINPLHPIQPPGTQQRSPDRRWHDHPRRSDVPAEGTTDDAGERHDSDPLVDDYA